jgi:hypothetical protein
VEYRVKSPKFLLHVFQYYYLNIEFLKFYENWNVWNFFKNLEILWKFRIFLKFEIFEYFEVFTFFENILKFYKFRYFWSFEIVCPIKKRFKGQFNSLSPLVYCYLIQQINHFHQFFYNIWMNIFKSCPLPCFCLIRK